MIEAVVRRARKRYIANELLAQGAYAASAGMSGLILLLIAGTQILDWRFLAAISAGTLALGTYRTLRRIPSAYAIAQLVDQRLMLADVLSTALYFAGADRKGSASMREGQRKQAERAAGQVDPGRAVPFAMPRAAYALAALTFAASGLFALRYGFSRSLDLRAPLARIVMDSFGAGPVAEEAALRKNPRAPKPETPQPIGLTLPEGEPNSPQQLDPAPDSALDTVGIPDAVNDPLAQNQKNAKAKSESADTQKAEGEQGDSESSDALDAAGGESSKDGSEGGKKGGQSAPNEGQPSRANSDQNAGLMAKLRDAMSNLLSKMHPQNGSGSQQQSSAAQNAQKAAQRGGQRQNGAAGEGQQQQAGGQESADAESQQQGAEGKDGQSAQSKGSGHSAEQQASNQPGSGIGRQDGNKDSKLAEQLAAMGKISEIIGKRSANVTGEVTVEVENSNPQLRTPYSQRSAHHTEGDAEISRDEVPVALQAFVQHYFEQVRK